MLGLHFIIRKLEVHHLFLATDVLAVDYVAAGFRYEL